MICRRLFQAVMLAVVLVPLPCIAQSSETDGIWLDQGERLKDVPPPAAEPLLLDGWTRQGRGEVYRLKVKAGETVKIDLSSSSEFVYVAVFDLARPDDDAIFFSDTGSRTTLLKPDADTEWLIRPTLILSSPRRGLGAHYVLRVQKQP